MSANPDPVYTDPAPTRAELVRKLWAQFEPPKDGRTIVATTLNDEIAIDFWMGDPR